METTIANYDLTVCNIAHAVNTCVNLGFGTPRRVRIQPFLLIQAHHVTSLLNDATGIEIEIEVDQHKNYFDMGWSLFFGECVVHSVYN